MGKNNLKRKVKTIFLDIDGTLVHHNYDPEVIDDIFIESVLNWLKLEFFEHKSEIILTTARSHNHCIKIVESLLNQNIHIKHLITDLSAGHRILINDKKYSDIDTAFAINLDRNKGFI